MSSTDPAHSGVSTYRNESDVYNVSDGAEAKRRTYSLGPKLAARFPQFSNQGGGSSYHTRTQQLSASSNVSLPEHALDASHPG